MEATLELVLEQARQADLKAIRTEVAALGGALVVRASVLIGNREFSAHAVAEHPQQLVGAETEALLRAFGFAGLDTTTPEATAAPAPAGGAPAARETLFGESARPLYPDPEPLEAEADLEEADAPFDRDGLLAETTSLMAALRMDARAGRSYLMDTYGKRSRNELSDAELESFVQYLRAQAHNQNTSKLPF
jgi:hypothetical protein